MVAVDDTLFRRRGKKIWAASWSHDGSAAGKGKTGYGHNWVIAGIIVMLPMISRPVCLPVLFRLVIKGTNSTSRLWLARRMAETLAAALPGRMIHVTGDAAYAGKELRALPGAATWATRFRKDAALHEPPPRRTGQPAMYAPHWPRSSGTTCTRGSRASSTLPVLRRRHDTGLLVCTWPYGGRPTVPIRYADEIWSGVEYQVAGHLAYEGMTA